MGALGLINQMISIINTKQRFLLKHLDERQGAMTDKTYSVSEDLILADIDDQLVGMSIQLGKYHNFGRTGTDILKQIKERKSIEEIVQQLVMEYDVTEQKCREEVNAFIKKLISLKIIKAD